MALLKDHQIQELEDDLLCLRCSINSFTGDKASGAYKELTSKLRKIIIETYKIDAQDKSFRDRIKVIHKDTKELYHLLQEASTNFKSDSGVRTYFPSIEETVNFSKLLSPIDMLRHFEKQLDEISEERIQKSNCSDDEKRDFEEKVNSLLLAILDIDVQGREEYELKGKVLEKVSHIRML